MDKTKKNPNPIPINEQIVEVVETSSSRYLADYPDVLTPTECMHILSIGRNAIYRLLQNDILKSVKIGKQYRIPKSSLENYLNQCYYNKSIDNSALT